MADVLLNFALPALYNKIFSLMFHCWFAFTWYISKLDRSHINIISYTVRYYKINYSIPFNHRKNTLINLSSYYFEYSNIFYFLFRSWFIFFLNFNLIQLNISCNHTICNLTLLFDLIKPQIRRQITVVGIVYYYLFIRNDISYNYLIIQITAK